MLLPYYSVCLSETIFFHLLISDNNCKDPSQVLCAFLSPLLSSEIPNVGSYFFLIHFLKRFSYVLKWIYCPIINLVLLVCFLFCFYSTHLIQFIFLPIVLQLLNISFLFITTHILSYLKPSAFPCGLHIYLCFSPFSFISNCSFFSCLCSVFLAKLHSFCWAIKFVIPILFCGGLCQSAYFLQSQCIPLDSLGT